MLNKIKDKFVYRLIFNAGILTLRVKNSFDDISGSESINFIGVVFFEDDGVASGSKVIIADETDFGMLGFSGKIHVESQGKNPADLKQFFIRCESNDKTLHQIIVVYEKVIIDSDPFLYSPMK
jgi:hypothetical protein